MDKEELINNNMTIWDQVDVTDPAHTKKVEFGRKFTAIDAHYQIMTATQVFGPVGTGWGYTTVFGFQDIGDEVYIWCDLTLWYSEMGQWEGNNLRDRKHSFGPIRGMCVVRGFKADGKAKTADHDAPKKAMTDALTKGLSHLGFSADVFLGKFDDNKYVEGLRKEKDNEASAKEQEYQQTRTGFIAKIQSCKKKDDIDKVMTDYKLWIERLPPNTAVEIRSWVQKQIAETQNGHK